MRKSLKDLRQLHGEAMGRIKAVQDKVAAEKRDALTAEEDTAVAKDLAEAESLADQIKTAERIQAQELIATRQAAENINRVDVTENRAPGSIIANVVRSIVMAKNQAIHPAQYARDVLQDERVAKALTAGGTTAGGYLVPSDMTSELYAALRAAAVVRRAGAVTIGMPQGNMNVPKINTGSSASWIGENANAPRTEPVFGRVALSFKKLAALVPVSNDFMRYASPSTNELIQNDLVAALATAEDVAFIRGASGGDNPVGIANQLASGQKVAMTATPDLDKITKDLNNCKRRVVASNVILAKAGWLMSPRTKFYLAGLRNSQGALAFPTIDENDTLLGYPVHMTTQIPENLGAGTNETEVYFVEFTHCIIGEALNLSIAVSDTAAYHDGSSVVSAFSLDQTVIRVIEEVDFGLRFDKSGAMVTGVTWS